MATWITRLESHGDGPRLAVKDAIDVADVVTTAGCAALADKGLPAATDAPCVASARQAGARIVGKTNLHELCFGTSGFNPWYGTPVNPVAGDRVPGGSSSGSAVAVATEEADVAYGTDTGGSVRIPAACCGVAGLKTTRGRVPLDGVWPLAPSLDTVGPLARDVEGIVSGMRLIEPGFTPSESARMVGRFRPADVDVDPALDSAVDRVLRQSGITTVEIELEGWEQIPSAFRALIMSESWQSNATLIQGFRDRVGEPVRSRLEACTELDPALIPIAVRKRERWKATIADVFTRVQAIIMPTLVGMPPLLGVDGVENILVFPWNVSGSPALALPVPIASWTMAGSMQVVGPNGSEEMLCATGAILEAAARSLERR